MEKLCRRCIKICATIIAFVIVLPLWSQIPSAEQVEIPLEEILNNDGTINLPPGFNGTLNTQGWSMQLNPDGSPKFTRDNIDINMSNQYSFMADPDDVKWDNRFTVTGGDNAIYAIAITGENIYIGGTFTAVNGMPANGIARWDGSEWHPVGEGVSIENGIGTVRAIEISGTDLYVGGWFDKAGTIDAGYIARWNTVTETWHALGGGTNGSVNTIKTFDGTLYAGGEFILAGGVMVNRIARWDGKNWYSLGYGLDGGSVYTLAVFDGDLYAGGSFNREATTSANLRRFARWDGDSWNESGGGVNSQVNRLAVHDDGIYIAGQFTQVNIEGGGITANYIGFWNGSDWETLGEGLNNPSYAITVNGDNVYVGGTFTSAGSIAANGIARWDGTIWSPVGTGVNYLVLDIAVHGDNLYAAGLFTRAGDINACNIAMWDGNWNTLGSAVSNKGVLFSVISLAAMGGDLYVGGRFGGVGDLPANNIARWDGTTWHAMGDGVIYDGRWIDARILAIEVVGHNVYVGGKFNSAGIIDANNIARWNTETETWHPLGDGIDNIVSSIRAAGGNIFVGGAFDTAGGVTVNNIARWNGTNWFSLGGGLTGLVYAIEVIGSELYVGGSFWKDANDTKQLRMLAKWDGSAWYEVGGGLNNGVYALAAYKNGIYVAGDFTEVNIEGGGMPANRIAYWNGSEWSALGGGLNQKVNTIAIKEDDVYVGGSFTFSGILDANYVTKWDGTHWHRLGSGTNNHVESLAFLGEDLYAGGGFTLAGRKPSVGIARWGEPLTNVPERPGTLPAEYRLEQNFPNPFNPSTTIRFSITREANVTLTVYDILGRKIENLVDEYLPAGEYTKLFDAGHLAGGVYIYRLQAGGHTEVKKLLYLK